MAATKLHRDCHVVILITGHPEIDCVREVRSVRTGPPTFRNPHKQAGFVLDERSGLARTHLHWCTTGVLVARPAGFEPAPGGLEVLADAFVNVRRNTHSRLNKPFPHPTWFGEPACPFMYWCINWCGPGVPR